MACIASAVLAEHQSLVKRIAMRMITKLPSNIELDDLIQVGMIGLQDALSRYSPTHNATFATFASRRIQGAMLDELRSTDWMSRDYRKKQREITDVTRELQQTLGRNPTESEIATKLGIDIDDYQELKNNLVNGIISLEDLGSEDSDLLDYAFPSDDVTPLDQLQRRQQIDAVVAQIKKLPQRSQQILQLRLEEKTYDEIGKLFNISPSRACQIADDAVKILRLRLKDAV